MPSPKMAANQLHSVTAAGRGESATSMLAKPERLPWHAGEAAPRGRSRQGDAEGVQRLIT